MSRARTDAERECAEAAGAVLYGLCTEEETPNTFATSLAVVRAVMNVIRDSDPAMNAAGFSAAPSKITDPSAVPVIWRKMADAASPPGET